MQSRRAGNMSCQVLLCQPQQPAAAAGCDAASRAGNGTDLQRSTQGHAGGETRIGSRQGWRRLAAQLPHRVCQSVARAVCQAAAQRPAPRARQAYRRHGRRLPRAAREICREMHTAPTKSSAVASRAHRDQHARGAFKSHRRSSMCEPCRKGVNGERGRWKSGQAQPACSASAPCRSSNEGWSQ